MDKSGILPKILINEKDSPYKQLALGQSGDKIEHQVNYFVPQGYLAEFKS